MNQFTPRTFDIPALRGISTKTIEEHLKLYQGYVKNLNGIYETLKKYYADQSANAYAINELYRRLSFEYNGMRNHEVYFASLEGGARPLSPNGPLAKAITAEAGSVEAFIADFKNLATTTRGIGWAVLWYDLVSGRLIASWIDEQHIGELNGCAMILGVDMWEHSYVADYLPSGKKQYVEDLFANLNWEVIEENFQKAGGAEK